MRSKWLCILLACVFVPAAGCRSMRAAGGPRPPTVYVAADGTGDFNCDGTSDQLQINEALAFVATHPEFHTVHLKGPRAYVISGTVFIDSDTTLTGDASAAIRLVDHADWPTYKPMVTMKAKGARNITVCGFEIDGNDENNMDMDARENKVRYGGHNWYNLLEFNTVTNLSVHHMYLHNNLNDACLAKRVTNLSYHHNTIDKPGHDGLYCYVCDGVDAHDNTFANRINCSIRFAETNHARAWNNHIKKAYGGGAGIQVQRSNKGTVMDDIEIFGNTIHETRMAGITIYSNDRTTYTRQMATGVRVHHNVIYLTGGSGVNIDGFYGTIVENNVLDACNGTAIYAGVARRREGSGSATVVRNNIICNTRPSGKAAGIGIVSASPAKGNIVSGYNCLFNNPGGHYSGEGIASSGDILDKDPMFVNAPEHDYRLKPGSPCPDAGARAIAD